jgi:hypothetical protein
MKTTGDFSTKFGNTIFSSNLGYNGDQITLDLPVC